jgi:hypothetical protein
MHTQLLRAAVGADRLDIVQAAVVMVEPESAPSRQLPLEPVPAPVPVPVPPVPPMSPVPMPMPEPMLAPDLFDPGPLPDPFDPPQILVHHEPLFAPLYPRARIGMSAGCHVGVATGFTVGAGAVATPNGQTQRGVFAVSGPLAGAFCGVSVGAGYGPKIDAALGYDWLVQIPFQDRIAKAWTEGGVRWRTVLAPFRPLHPLKTWIAVRAQPLLRRVLRR